jgi:anti-sigma regulatory factor (Ser/Thr protein kinase)
MRPPTPDGSGRSAMDPSGAPAAAGLLTAPLAEALAVLPPHPGSLEDAGVSGGGCFVRPLPVDTTCASAARRFFREALSSLPIPSGLLHDGVTMASELAANTLHAQRNAASGSARQRAASGVPEIWVYLRGDGLQCELVCKVFDSERDWHGGLATGMDKAPVDSVDGRGLQVVDGLSAGHWGCHLTLSRLGTWKAPGKAVWFALRIPPAALPDHLGRPRFSPDWLVDELEDMLVRRGLTSIVRANAGGISVLSISRHLTVWRHRETISWRTSTGEYQRMDIADTVEVAEQIVCANEEAAAADPLNFGPSPVAFGNLSVAG